MCCAFPALAQAVKLTAPDMSNRVVTFLEGSGADVCQTRRCTPCRDPDPCRNLPSPPLYILGQPPDLAGSCPRSLGLRASRVTRDEQADRNDDIGPHQLGSTDHAVHISGIMWCRRPRMHDVQPRLAGADVWDERVQYPGRAGQPRLLAAAARRRPLDRSRRQRVGLLLAGPVVPDRLRDGVRVDAGGRRRVSFSVLAVVPGDGRGMLSDVRFVP